MAIDPDTDRATEDSDREIDWAEYAYQETQRKKPAIPLDATDYVALLLASLQTIFLPIVILAVLLLILGLYFGILF
ncbi:hypothetical protein EU537_10615 [Candidatus Thorarchaeota archaeon]|nr:MAG: hypothetical protein EU537_10615 [Candidatus Thorarchaeota archaeon]